MNFDLRDSGDGAAMQRPSVSNSAATEQFPPDDKIQAAVAPALLKKVWRMPLRMLSGSGLGRFVIIAAGTVAFSWLGEELLDFLHKEIPASVPMAKADYVARKAWSAERFVFRLGKRAAKAGYDAVPAQAAEMAPAMPASNPVHAPDTGSSPLVSSAITPSAKPRRSNTASLRETAGSPNPETERLNRAEFARHQQPSVQRTVQMAPDGMPAAGGYDSATGIAWSGYLKAIPSLPEPMPAIAIEPAPVFLAEPISDGYFKLLEFGPQGHPRSSGEQGHHHEQGPLSRLPRFHGPAFGPMRHH